MLDNFKTVLLDDDSEYVIQVCSATQQWKMLQMFSRYGLSDALFYLASGEKAMVAAAFFGKFAEKATDQEQAEVTKMLLGNCVKLGDDKPIKIDDFHNRMAAYIQLHIEALKLNYADFMPFLQSAEETKPESEKADTMSTL
ncbi:hypothetical protein PQE20_27480 (plasmid) [Vibrio harveyi]|uniref:phage tail assembly chaperone n=1 Tax=Vibrio harveyi TaxID=669 RepID=UPI00234CDE72|nr:hypothetical protein [Vibrio harveyi]WCP84223.1 hypothetical protein PQE20_27480 [Vibrio harveyi]